MSRVQLTSSLNFWESYFEGYCLVRQFFSILPKWQKGENGYKQVKIGENGTQLKYVIARMHKKLKNTHYGTTNLRQRAESRVRVVADKQNSAPRA